jgi:hypothetical protein
MARRLAQVILALALLVFLPTYLYLSSPEGVRDLVGGEVRVAVAFELEPELTGQLVETINLRMVALDVQNISWMERLSEANVLLVAVKNWSHTLHFENVDGLGDFARSVNRLSAEDYRSIVTVNSPEGIVLVVVAYMVPDLNTWAFDCISENIAEAMVDASRKSEDSFGHCILNQRQ